MPQCTPTRVALMTGRYPGRFGGHAMRASNDPAFPHGTPTLAKMFQDAGYETFMSGKWHLGSTDAHGPNFFGFDESHGSLTGAVGMYNHRYHAKNDTPYDPTWHRNHVLIPGSENGIHVTDLTRNEAVKFIQYLPFHAPHTPLDERGQFVDTPTQIDPANPHRWLNEDKITWFNDPAGKIQAEESRDKRLMLATLHHLDSAIGDIVDALEKSGQRQNTIILFSSDNGPWVNNNSGGYPDNVYHTDYNQPDRLRGKKLDVWEGGIHVPGFINWPEHIEPGKVTELVHIIDWFPTLASIIDKPQKINFDGVDLSPLLLKNEKIAERDLYWTWKPDIDRWALRYKNWKIVNYGDTQPEAGEWQLFNLEIDPSETTNLAEKYPEQVIDLHKRFLNQRLKDKK